MHQFGWCCVIKHTVCGTEEPLRSPLRGGKIESNYNEFQWIQLNKVHPHWQTPLNTQTHTHTHPILLPHRLRLETPDVQLWLWLASRTKPPVMTHSLWFNATVNRASGGDARMLSVCDWYSRSLYGYISLWNSSFPCREHLWGSASGCGIPGAQQPIWSLNKKECVWNNSHFSWRWLTVIQMEKSGNEKHWKAP